MSQVVERIAVDNVSQPDVSFKVPTLDPPFNPIFNSPCHNPVLDLMTESGLEKRNKVRDIITKIDISLQGIPTSPELFQAKLYIGQLLQDGLATSCDLYKLAKEYIILRKSRLTRGQSDQEIMNDLVKMHLIDAIGGNGAK